MEAKSIKNQLQNDIQDSISKFNPLWPENQTQDTSKTLPRRPHDAPRGPKTLQDVPKRVQDASKTTPRRLPDGSRYSQDAPKTPLNFPRHPKMLPRRPKTPPDLDFGASRPDFLEVSSSNIINCWIFWDRFFR